MTTGLHNDLDMPTYLALDAIGSTNLEWLAISPMFYRWMKSQPREETDATRIGTAVHMAALEPFKFPKHYVCEPDPDQFGGSKPRATKAYKDAVDGLRADGRAVLKTETMASVLEMGLAVRANPHVGALLRRAEGREVAALWRLGSGRRCRGRLDILGDDVAADLKTTRSLKDFCPWAIQRLGYHRQAAWYAEGLRLCGRPVKHFFLIAVESSPPYDVGVFVLDQATLELGLIEVYGLIEKLDECERTGEWPGQFPNVEHAVLNLDAAAMAGAVDGAEV